MTNIADIRKKVDLYKKAAEKLAPLQQALDEIEERCQRIIQRDYLATRNTKYGSISEQVQEALRLGDVSTQVALQKLAPALRKAREDATTARQRVSTLRISIESATLELRGTIATEMQSLRQRIKEKIVAAISPFTSEKNASMFAEKMDVLVNLDFRTTNLAVSADLFSGFSICESAAKELETLRKTAA